MKMEARAMVIRGWPNEGALHRAEPIKAATTLVNGDFVMKDTDNTVIKSTATVANNFMVGLVVSGNGDSASAANSNKAVVLWGNYIANVDSTCYDTADTYVPGSKLMCVSGKLKLHASTNPVVGYVLDVVPVSTDETAHLTVVMK